MTKLFCDWCGDSVVSFTFLRIEKNAENGQRHEICEKCYGELDEYVKEFIKVRKDSVKEVKA